MSTKFSVKGSMRYIERDLGVNIPSMRNAAMRSAAGRVAARVKTEVVRDVAKTAKVKQKLIRNRISVSKMKRGEYGTVIKFRIWQLPAEALGRIKQTAGGVKVGRYEFPGAFPGKQKVGKTLGREAVFKRKGAPRLPLAKQGVPLEPYGDRLREIGDKVVAAEFPKRFRHEMLRRMEKVGLAVKK